MAPGDSSAGSDPRPSGSKSNSSDKRKQHSSYVHRGKGKGGRGGRGAGGKTRDMGRNAWSKQKGDKRADNDERQAVKKQKINNDDALPVYATKFEEGEIANEERRPKKKVAVMIGYSGTGYKGMQLAPDQKTIEGDLFKAFVAAGAISKANADDPKKSSFVRCARTDKGVHAAGNIISLKLIVEDEDIVKKINDALTPQIRIWGFERTNNSFSAYQLCDSRIYEYLIPTHSLLPPHPKSWLGRKCKEWAEKKNDVAAWQERQSEVEGYWEKVDAEIIQPILNQYDESIRNILERALWLNAEKQARKEGDGEGGQPLSTKNEDDDDLSDNDFDETPIIKDESTTTTDEPTTQSTTTTDQPTERTDLHLPTQPSTKPPLSAAEREARIARHRLINDASKQLRAAYLTARRAWRIPTARRERLEAALKQYLGTHNFHNYTILKTFSDPSAKRVIKSFIVNPTPILINGTEWLSLKVHGQSFMMHQIRKMVGMASLLVRCGADPATLIRDSYGEKSFSIPRAPALGLLLERPVFDTYNRRAKTEFGKEEIGFDKYQEEMEAFKQEFIYKRMWEDEERENVFGNFFAHVDNFPGNTFLWCTSGGWEACRFHGVEGDKKAKDKVDSEDEEEGGVRLKDDLGNEG